MARFTTKPAIIEAIKFTGENFEEVHRFTEGADRRSQFAWLVLGEDEEVRLANETDDFQAQVYDTLHDTWVNVKIGMYIIKGTKGEFYPCDPEVFEAKYEPVAEPVRRIVEPVREVQSPNPHQSSADAIIRGAEQVWGGGGIVTSNLPKRNPQHER